MIFFIHFLQSRALSIISETELFSFTNQMSNESCYLWFNYFKWKGSECVWRLTEKLITRWCGGRAIVSSMIYCPVFVCTAAQYFYNISPVFVCTAAIYLTGLLLCTSLHYPFCLVLLGSHVIQTCTTQCSPALPQSMLISDQHCPKLPCTCLQQCVLVWSQTKLEKLSNKKKVFYFGNFYPNGVFSKVFDKCVWVPVKCVLPNYTFLPSPKQNICEAILAPSI